MKIHGNPIRLTPYTLMGRGIGSDILTYCIGNNTGVLAYSTIEKRILTGKFNLDGVILLVDLRRNHLTLFQ